MKLLEYKGKQLLKEADLAVPDSLLLKGKDFDKKEYQKFLNKHQAVVIKAQVVGGGRKKAGLIFETTDYDSSLKQIEALFDKSYNKAAIESLLVEARLDKDKEFFLSILYDTIQRGPMVMFSNAGGIEIEENSSKISKYWPAKVAELIQEEALEITGESSLAEFLVKAYTAFIKFDCSHLEINPIILTKDGQLFAADAKLTIDDGAIARQELLAGVAETDQKTNFSEMELAARKIDQEDHRGVAGKTFVELDGDIAVLASGGGASLTSMDALIEAGGAPANYTEYSGNPPREKVRQLTKITLSKPGLNGCLIIGGTANFTDIFDTLSGVVEGMEDLPELPKYPIVIRRAGPRDQEAFNMIKKFAQKNKLDITLFGETTPMSYAAKVMAEKVEEYKKK